MDESINALDWTGGTEPTRDDIAHAAEALLFVTDEPVSVVTLADMLGVDVVSVQAALECLSETLLYTNSGIQLREVAGGWRLTTHPQYHDLIERYVVSWDTRKLSQAALETLAVVAYCQPITRNGVASVRGVNSDSSINSLVEKGLLREAGVQDSPGNPTVYATTKTFLERFGLRSLADLPDLESFAPDDETRAFIAERLNVVTADAATIAALEDNEGEATFEIIDEGDVQVADAMQMLLDEALGQAASVVDKIDFSQLEFDEDD